MACAPPRSRSTRCTAGLARLVGMDDRRARHGAGPSSARRCAGTGRTSTSSSCTTSIPTRPARTATSAARSTGIEEFDAGSPTIVELAPDVLIVTGDHSTPARLKSHSWHPVPVLLAAATCRPDLVESFGERPCLAGGLGQLEAKHLLPLALAHAGRLAKFGA